MKYRVRTSIGILFFLSIFILSGCSSILDLSYVAKSKSPLMMTKPMTIALQIEDNRNIEERDRVGNWENAFGKVSPCESTKKATLVLHDGLMNELENNGHKIVDAKKDNYDAFIKVFLNKYWADHRMHFWDFEVLGTINADISIQNGRNDSILFSRVINVTFRESGQMNMKAAYESVLNGALEEFIRRFSREPGILKALKKAHEESKG